MLQQTNRSPTKKTTERKPLNSVLKSKSIKPLNNRIRGVESTTCMVMYVTETYRMFWTIPQNREGETVGLGKLENRLVRWSTVAIQLLLWFPLL